MSRILICIDDPLLGIRISRILSSKALAYDMVNTPINKEDIYRYDTLIIHSSYRLTGLYSFIENILIHKTLPIVYVSLNIVSNPFQRLSENDWFIHIDEAKMDSELPLALTMFQKNKHRLEDLIKDNKELSTKLKTEQIISKCKRKLQDEGMTEEEAHKYILKYAMDCKISKTEACLKILSKNN